MLATKQDGLITYTGYDPENNGKWVIETSEIWTNYTYCNYQEDEFTQVIFGYVVKQDNGKYKAFKAIEENVKYFDTVEQGIEYIKSLKESQNNEKIL